jgi:hypothetical protein
MPFALNPTSAEERKDENLRRQFRDSNRQNIVFARYDIKSIIPVILWADLVESDNAEIGFSSIKLWPQAVVQLFEGTCFVRLKDSETQEIYGHVMKHINP